MKYDREYTPERVDFLAPNEIFVFGSNIGGIHAGGAARLAHACFGAVWGVGEGLTGRCYALPTMEGDVDYVAQKVQKFLDCARHETHLRFLVTRVGCGIAGFRDDQIAPLFRCAIDMPNVILPRTFVEIIEALELRDGQ